jgi:hypothetical protein
MGYNTKTWCLALLGALATAPGGVARVSAIDPRQGPPSLFADAPRRAAAERDLEHDRTEIRSRLVTVDFAALQDERAVEPAPHARPALVLNLFDDAVFSAVLDRVDVAAGGFTWVGHIAGVELSNVTLATGDGVMAGSVVTPAAVYSIRYRGSGLHQIRQVDQSQFPPELDPIRISPGGQEDVSAFGESVVTGDDGSTIDVMVLYTPAAATAAGGTSAMTTLINLGVSETNTSYSNSGVVQRLRLVHAEQVPYTEDPTGGLNRDLTNLRHGYGALAGVGTLRDTYGADIVTLLVNNTGDPGACGFGYLMTSVSTTFAANAFNVVQQDCVSPNYSFAHELGHNMGAMHDWFTDNGVQPYTYAHGYVYATNRWRTIMTYNDLCSAQGFSCTRLLYWSNPGVSYGGIPMGIAGGTNSSCPSGDVSNVFCDADDHRALNNTALTVANFRPTVVTARLSATPTSLRFAATKAGAAGNLTAVTAAQTVTVSVAGASTGWTASADQPWVQLTNASGINAGQFTVSIINPGNVLGGSTSVAATVTITPTTVALTVTTVSVALAIDQTNGAATAGPFGAFDTPIDGAAGLQGSFAVTGWALDDIGIDRVELWRDPVAGETTPTYYGPGQPGHGKIFIANPFFVAGSRPDVEAAYPNSPGAYRAGWGYLLLSHGLWNEGNGSYTLYAYAFDLEGNWTLLGTKTITVDNAHATAPFGTIDTPGYGATVSGGIWNYGWALTPANTQGCTITNGNVLMGIDSAPLVPVNYGDARADVAAAFPGLTNSSAASGAYFLDTTQLTNGMHQIGWLVYDSCGRGDGIGSRFFTVLNGSGDAAAVAATDALSSNPGPRPGNQPRRASKAGVARDRRPDVEVPSLRRDSIETRAAPDDSVRVRRLGTDWEVVAPNATGTHVIRVEQTGRVEVHLPALATGEYTAFQEVQGEQRPLPLGSSLDPRRGVFYWQPAPGFLGVYDLVFAPSLPTAAAVHIRVVVGLQSRNRAPRRSSPTRLDRR